MSLKIALVGECWGAEEEIARKPFIGAAGQELNRMLKDAGIRREDCFLTNVFNLRPPGNDVEFFLAKKGAGVPLSTRFTTPLVQSKFLKQEFEGELIRLFQELEDLKPNLCVCLGNTALWALLNVTAISKLRGSVCYSKELPWLKCLPCYHPAAILRQYELRHTGVLDFVKAKNEGEFPEIKRIERTIILDPTLSDIEWFYQEHILTAKRLACDIETNYGEQITCIGFAPNKNLAICVPIYDYRKPTCSFWETIEEELEAWNLIAKILDSPCEKIFQNGLFDMQHLWQNYGIPTRNAGEDSMLLHHSLHPEAPKALDFLGSVYSSEVAWKTHKPKNKTIKRES
jgi:uracil-DNA glycosylase